MRVFRTLFDVGDALRMGRDGGRREETAVGIGEIFIAITLSTAVGTR